MKDLLNFLLGLRNDVFKLLPMKEAALSGIDNHIGVYLDSLIAVAKGGLATYPNITTQKAYLYAINNLSYLLAEIEQIAFEKWRKIILDTTRSIDDLYIANGGEKDGKRS